MNIFKYIKKWIFLLLLVIPLVGMAQDDKKPTRKQKKAEQKKEQRVKESKKSEFKSKKQHMKLQDKQTRKRMKKHKRKGMRYVSTKPNFFQRLFNTR